MKALLIIDMQKDFMSQGAWPIFQAEELIPIINRLMHFFQKIYATKDWHLEGNLTYSHG